MSTGSSDSDQPATRKFTTILRLKPTPSRGLTIEPSRSLNNNVAASGFTVVIPSGTGKSTQPSRMHIDDVVEMKNVELFQRIEPLVADVARGETMLLLMYGSSGSGKTYTLEGQARRNGTAGIVSMIFKLLCTSGTSEGGKISAQLSEARRGLQEHDLGKKTDFYVAEAAQAWYADACARRVSAARLAPSTGGTEGPSSRSWTRLEIKCIASGGTVLIYDVPGREMNSQADSKFINDKCEQLRQGLIQAVKDAAAGKTCNDKAVPYATSIDRVARFVGQISMWAKRSHHAVFIGCVDPTPGEQCTRAVSTIALLNELAQARLPPLPKRVVLAVPAVIAAPAVTAAPAVPAVPAAENAHETGWAKVPIVDEDIRSKVQEILTLAEQKLSGLEPIVETLEQLEAKRLDATCHTLAQELSLLLADFKDKLEVVKAQEWHAINDRRELLTYLIMIETQRSKSKRLMAKLQSIVHARLEKIILKYKGLIADVPGHAVSLADAFFGVQLDVLNANIQVVKLELKVLQLAVEKEHTQQDALAQRTRLERKIEGLSFKFTRATEQFLEQAAKNKDLMAKYEALRQAVAVGQGTSNVAAHSLADPANHDIEEAVEHETEALADEYTPFQSAPYVPLTSVSSSEKKKNDSMATGTRVDTVLDLGGAGIRLPKRIRPFHGREDDSAKKRARPDFHVHQDNHDSAPKRRRSLASAATTSAQGSKRKPLAVRTPAEANSGQLRD